MRGLNFKFCAARKMSKGEKGVPTFGEPFRLDTESRMVAGEVSDFAGFAMLRARGKPREAGTAGFACRRHTGRMMRYQSCARQQKARRGAVG